MCDIVAAYSRDKTSYVSLASAVDSENLNIPENGLCLSHYLQDLHIVARTSKVSGKIKTKICAKSIGFIR